MTPPPPKSTIRQQYTSTHVVKHNKQTAKREPKHNVTQNTTLLSDTIVTQDNITMLSDITLGGIHPLEMTTG